MCHVDEGHKVRCVVCWYECTLLAIWSNPLNTYQSCLTIAIGAQCRRMMQCDNNRTSTRQQQKEGTEVAETGWNDSNVGDETSNNHQRLPRRQYSKLEINNGNDNLEIFVE